MDAHANCVRLMFQIYGVFKDIIYILVVDLISFIFLESRLFYVILYFFNQSINLFLNNIKLYIFLQTYKIITTEYQQPQSTPHEMQTTNRLQQKQNKTTKE